MPRFFAIILVMVLASYSIGHKVLTVPLSIQNANDMNVADNAVNLNSGIDNLGLKDVNEEYVVNSQPFYLGSYYIYVWYPEEEYSREQRYVLDTKIPWMATRAR